MPHSVPTGAQPGAGAERVTVAALGTGWAWKQHEQSIHDDEQRPSC